jgi:hypothetical protein
METKTSFVGSDRAVELYAIAIVDTCLTVVIYPRYAEKDLAFRCYKALQKSFFLYSFFGFNYDAKTSRTSLTA